MKITVVGTGYVGLVSGITRPLGEVPPEFRATYQAGIVGDRLADGSAQIGQRYRLAGQRCVAERACKLGGLFQQVK